MAKLSDSPLFGIDHYPGWHGCFTRESSDRAKFPNGARIEKSVNESGDAHPLGSRGTVLGSIWLPERGVGYFVEWDSDPKTACFVVEFKLAAIQN